MPDVLAQRSLTIQVPDPLRLQIEFDLLSGLVDELDASTPTGMRAALTRRHQAVGQQLVDAIPALEDRRVVVLDPGELTGIMSRQGQPLTPVMTAERVPTFGVSSASVWMPPQHTSKAHVHYGTGVAVLVLQGHAITLWWDADGRMHEAHQRAGQHLYIPHGVPHAAINPAGVPVVAAEFRGNSVFGADNELLPDLDAQVATRMATHLNAA